MEISTKTSTAQKTSTLGKSRKKKAAPPPPTVQQQQTKISSSATTDTKSTSSPAKTKKKAKKPPQDEFMAFKVKVINLKQRDFISRIAFFLCYQHSNSGKKGLAVECFEGLN